MKRVRKKRRIGMKRVGREESKEVAGLGEEETRGVKSGEVKRLYSEVRVEKFVGKELCQISGSRAGRAVEIQR